MAEIVSHTPYSQMTMRKGIKRFLPRTLFGRSLMIIITPILLLQIIVTVVFFDRHWSAMTQRLALALAGEVSQISSILEENSHLLSDNMKQYAVENLSLLITFEPDAKLAIDKHRRWNSIVHSTLAEALTLKLGRPFDIRQHEKKKWLEISVQLENGVLRVLSPEHRLYSSTTYIFLLWMLGSSIVLLVVAILFLRNQVRPIRRLAMAADRFGRGVDVPSFKPEGALEVRQAAQAFLEMRERIQRQIEQRTAMLAGVSHDLRTALTRMRLQLEMLGDSPDVEALKADITEMERMVEGYLAFARGEGDERAESTDISRILDTLTTNARRQGREINLQAEEGLMLRVKPQALERALGNLINNACKYADKIWVQMYRQGGFVEVTIDDNGPGIPDEQKQEVFKPFVRVEGSRNPKTGGVGLGLSIAQDIIHSHGGELLLEDSNRGGLRAVVRLPV